MTNIAVISNCQATGLSNAVRALVPDAGVLCVNLAQPDGQAFCSDRLGEIAHFDLVIAAYWGEEMGRVSASAITALARRVVFVPALLFWGFHPDVTYLPTGFRAHQSPLRDYHSILVLAGFLRGLSARETEALFNPLVFGRLGYFSSYEREVTALHDSIATVGLAMPDAVDRWQATGCFMHSPNHPVRDVIHDVARAALLSAGLTPDGTADLAALPDTLAPLPRFPIYPEIGARLGLHGSHEFRPDGGYGDDTAVLPLRDFIEASYDGYADTPDVALYEAFGVSQAMAALRN